MFTSLFQGEVLILLDFLVNGELKNRLEGFCSTIELHPRFGPLHTAFARRQKRRRPEWNMRHYAMFVSRGSFL
jgi:hypothetical protein